MLSHDERDFSLFYIIVDNVVCIRIHNHQYDLASFILRPFAWSCMNIINSASDDSVANISIQGPNN